MFLTPDPEFEITTPDPTVELHLPDGRVLKGPRNAPVGRFLSILPEANNPPIVGAIINGELRELTFPIKIDSYVRPVTMSEADGMLIYRRSLVFLLETAFEDCFPDAALRVDHSVSSGGYYCQVFKRAPLSQEEIALLEAKMESLVGADLPFIRQEIPLKEAIAYFHSTGRNGQGAFAGASLPRIT